MRRIKYSTLLPALVFMFMSFGQVMTPAVSFACSATGVGSGAKAKILNGEGESGTGCNASGVNTLVSNIVILISEVAGILGIIMIVVAGIKFTTSGGDSNKVASAKNSLIYALIGLAIAAIAQAIVHFVLHQATTSIASK